jgi:hypothetical protein
MRAVRRVDDMAGQNRPVRLEPLPGHDETKLVHAAERRHIRAGEGSVGHVEVSWMNGVGTSILGRPRHLHTHRRASPYGTVICDEPVYGALLR